MSRTPLPRFEYDPEADALYIRLRPGAVRETVSLDENDDIGCDLDRRGRLLGIEIWPASRYVNAQALRLPALPRHRLLRPKRFKNGRAPHRTAAARAGR